MIAGAVVCFILGVVACAFGVLALGFVLFAIGIVLLVIGIVTTSNRANGVPMADNRQFYPGSPWMLIGTCNRCNTRFEAYGDQFRIHRKYPDGYIRCPHCNTPVHRNVFQVYDRQQFLQAQAAMQQNRGMYAPVQNQLPNNVNPGYQPIPQNQQIPQNYANTAVQGQQYPVQSASIPQPNVPHNQTPGNNQ